MKSDLFEINLSGNVISSQSSVNLEVRAGAESCMKTELYISSEISGKASSSISKYPTFVTITAEPVSGSTK